MKSKNLLHELFNQSLAYFPNNLAIQCKQQELTYTELAIYSDYFSSKLIQLKVHPNQLVAIIMDKGWEQVVAVLSVLKSGAAYLPIDPLESEERLINLLKISKVKIVLTQKKYESCLNWPNDKIIISIEAISIENEITLVDYNPRQRSTDLAYVLFTSGSTGSPKGVMISHQNALNTILDVNTRFRIGYQDKFIALSQLTFDLSVYDIFGCLGVGGTLVIPEASYGHDLHHWEILVFQTKVSVWNSVPALMDIFVDYLDNKYSSIPEHGLRLVLLSGDWIPLKLPEKIRQLFGKEIVVVSLGGATEASIWSILYPIEAINPKWTSIPYGKAMVNQSFHILDQQLNPIVKTMIGELFIGGLGVAQGYWCDEERTNAQFIQHPVLGRLYKTGDLGRYLSDGNIEFLGRVDFQVKIAGYRIEVKAIEKYLLDFPNVEQAIVLLQSGGCYKKLVAYLVLNRDKYLAERNYQLEFEQINYWKKIYDDLFNKDTSRIEDPTFNTVGWVSSAKNKAIPPTHMREWIENTAKRILKLEANSVLEIGCGTGLLLFRLAPYVQIYEAMDLSKNAIEYVQNQLKNLAIENVNLYVGDAENIQTIKKRYDLVVLNSVIQYFPSVDYLIEVLNQTLDKVKTKGYIFIGDIRSLFHLRAFYSAILLEKQPYLSDPHEWKLQLDNLVDKEDELALDTDFFYAFQKANPCISHVEILLKEGRFHNEMNRFRYDVTLYIEHPIDNSNELVVWRDWEAQPVNFYKLKADWLHDKASYLAIKNIPNKRTIGLQAISTFGLNNTTESLSDLKIQRDVANNTALDPNLFFTLANSYKFLITVKWSNKNPVDFFDVIIRKSACNNYFHRLHDSNEVNKPLKDYANLPILSRIHNMLISDIQNFLKMHLPWYMVPSYFVIIKQMPINTNGKIDRNNLPKIASELYQKDIKIGSEVTSTQKTLMDIWKKLFSIDRLNIHHSFTELGGTSLLAVQLIGEIHTTFGVTVHIQDILLHGPTIAELSLLIDQNIPLR